jgi:hypothetical protein
LFTSTLRVNPENLANARRSQMPDREPLFLLGPVLLSFNSEQAGAQRFIR